MVIIQNGCRCSRRLAVTPTCAKGLWDERIVDGFYIYHYIHINLYLVICD